MAKLTNNRAKAAIAKEQKRLDAIQKKMETQRKKEEFGTIVCAKTIRNCIHKRILNIL